VDALDDVDTEDDVDAELDVDTLEKKFVVWYRLTLQCGQISKGLPNITAYSVFALHMWQCYDYL